jgi:hypothetical protein
MFDAPIPSRPTFLLNLLYEKELVPDMHRAGGTARDKGEPIEGEGLAAGAEGPAETEIYMPRSNQSGLAPFTRFEPGNPIARLVGFGWQMVNTARYWNDNQLMAIPGYRDRIVHIKMFEGEGGLNLAMKPEQIERLKKRGFRAGDAIAKRFLPGQTKDPLNPGKVLLLNWSNHRFVRLRAYLAGIEATVARFTINWEKDKECAARPEGDRSRVVPSLEEMVGKLGTAHAGELGQKSGYAFRNETQRKLALDVVDALAALKALCAASPDVGLDFVRAKGSTAPHKPSSPRPKPALRLRAPSDSDPRAERVPR